MAEAKKKTPMTPKLAKNLQFADNVALSMTPRLPAGITAATSADGEDASVELADDKRKLCRLYVEQTAWHDGGLFLKTMARSTFRPVDPQAPNIVSFWKEEIPGDVASLADSMLVLLRLVLDHLDQ